MRFPLLIMSFLCLFLLTLLVTFSHGQEICETIKACELCTDDELKNESYCQETGYKELLSCKTENEEESILRYQSCIPLAWLERNQFFFFQIMNLFIAFISILVVIWRRKKIQLMIQRRLRRRIH
jgi:hypothetical protein